MEKTIKEEIFPSFNSDYDFDLVGNFFQLESFPSLFPPCSVPTVPFSNNHNNQYSNVNSSTVSGKMNNINNINITRN
eukprot:Pgem_evm1s17275